MGLVIYKEERQLLGEVLFLKDISNQIKIKDIPKENYTHQLIKSMVLINNLAGIKEPMSDVVKTDIKEMILMRFKMLSFDEISYAFKLERYGSLGTRIEHYQLFDAEYVSKVLDKYLTWKKNKITQHNLNTSKQKESTEQEKEFIMLEAVDRIKKDYTFNKKITEECSHVYDYLYSKRSLQKHDKKFRDRIYQKAIKVAKNEAKALSKGDYDIRKDLKNILQKISEGNSDKIVPITKRLVLEEYFKNL